MVEVYKDRATVIKLKSRPEHPNHALQKMGEMQ